MPTLLTQIPRPIHDQLKTYLDVLRNYNAEVQRLRVLEQRLGQPGRYEADLYRAAYERVQAATAYCERFVAQATPKGIDVDAVYTALGGYEAPIPLSAAAQAWLA
jgi:hypothetical protein